jgi:hypothetical protein
VAEKAPPVTEEVPQVAEQAPTVTKEEQSVQLTNNQDNEYGEMNSKDMQERAKMGGNDVASKYMHDEIGGRYRKWCQLNCANGFCLQNRLVIF